MPFRDEDNDSFRVDDEELGRVGFFRLEDLTDLAPVFDLRDRETGTTTPFVWEDLEA